MANYITSTKLRYSILSKFLFTYKTLLLQVKYSIQNFNLKIQIL